MVQLADYAGGPTAWCPGCGNFGILTALKEALVNLELEPYQVLMVSGIGQAGKLPHYTKANVFNSLHGRAIPVAIGAKLANPDLTVIAIGGDGDGYAEGGNHTLHAMRRNHDITYLVHDNQVYGLTKGQASPTSDPGFVTKTTLHGADPPVNPVALAITAGATFVARSFAGDLPHLSQMIAEGIRHKGFALVDILQPCVTFNRKNTWTWYKDRVYHLPQKYEPDDPIAAYEKAHEWGERIPIGVLYHKEEPTFESRIPALKEGPLMRRKLDVRAAAGPMAEFG
jgi:2-oxoglutarate ferredoxin oxidoreductase subunit beta